jgi:hypothetical protein
VPPIIIPWLIFVLTLAIAILSWMQQVGMGG